MHTHEYFILTAKGKKGPYDMIALVRKIRNGALTGTAQLQVSTSEEIKPAQDYPELAEFFEKKDEKAAADEVTNQHRGLGATLSSGMNFLQRNQASTVFSGLFILIVILVTGCVIFLLPPTVHAAAFMSCFVFAHFLLSCYMLSVLRMARGQPVDLSYLVHKIGPAIKSLLIASLFICFPAIIGLALLTSQLPPMIQLVGLLIFILPGLYMLVLYVFTPLLIFDQGYDMWEAMEKSRKTVLKSGLENTGVIYALFVINFLGGLLVLLPMAITLPITMGAIAEIYDEMFS